MRLFSYSQTVEEWTSRVDVVSDMSKQKHFKEYLSQQHQAFTTQESNVKVGEKLHVHKIFKRGIFEGPHLVRQVNNGWHIMHSGFRELCQDN